VLFLGFDTRGVPLQVVAVEQADGNLLVIHAMKMRAQYQRYLEKGTDAKAKDRRTRTGQSRRPR